MSGRVRVLPTFATELLARDKVDSRDVREQQAKASTGLPFADQPGSITTAGPRLSRGAIIWLVIVMIVVLSVLGVVSWLLCSCKYRRFRHVRRHSNGERYHPSLEITDGRNEFSAWNRNQTQHHHSIKQSTEVGSDRRISWMSFLSDNASKNAHCSEQGNASIMIDVAAPGPSEIPGRHSGYFTGCHY